MILNQGVEGGYFWPFSVGFYRGRGGCPGGVPGSESVLSGVLPSEFLGGWGEVLSSILRPHINIVYIGSGGFCVSRFYKFSV